ncbi:MAG: hypothetical protein CMQ20_10855 [Gammaproteobacteria bacterium]|jgi:hypothetical protein|nr:hypothetical protein [Gammaproteobacteria bacterium]|tara:strand:- start:536 stop:778 length:243 start_codon:yes stop_codon:yes gene_type:complete
MTPSIRSLIACLFAALVCPLQAEEDFIITEQTTSVRLRQEPLQWTPETVTIVKKADMRRTYLRDLEDLEGIVLPASLLMA